MTAYDASQWSDFFVAAAGASAALAGLLFVAVSINIERILKFEGLPERALEALMLLLAVLLVSLVGLIPGQSHGATGAELLFLSLTIAAAVGRLPTTSSDPSGASQGRIRVRWALRIAALLPLVVGGAGVLLEAGGGLYWIAVGVVFCFAAAVASAWVLLVEILR